MTSQGRFEHIGRASIRLEGATAWGVWLRIDQWSSALLRLSHNCLQFNEIVLMWLCQLNLFFTVTSRVIQWQVRCHLPVQPPAPNDESRFLRIMVHQLIDVCRANQSHLTGLRDEVATLRSLVNTLVARPPPPPAHSAAQVNPEVTGPLPEVLPWRVRQTGRQPRVCRREG